MLCRLWSGTHPAGQFQDDVASQLIKHPTWILSSNGWSPTGLHSTAVMSSLGQNVFDFLSMVAVSFSPYLLGVWALIHDVQPHVVGVIGVVVSPLSSNLNAGDSEDVCENVL